jgi:tetratricopeptide (TPR) repeat protein
MSLVKKIPLLVLMSLCVYIAPAYPQIRGEITRPPNGWNQRAEVSQWIGLVKITIAYHSPAVHGAGGADRNGHLWGEFLPYGFFDEGFGPSRSTPWRAGANENTTISFSHDVKVEGKDLKAGTYALFLKLEKEGPWVWIFSNHSTGWGSYQYDPKNDALQVQVDPQLAPYSEYLTYGFDDRRHESALAFLQWENKRVPFKIEVPNLNELYVAQMRRDLEDWAGFSYENWQAAAQFCASNKIHLEEALIWADKAINEPFRGASIGREDFLTLGTRASVLNAMGREQEAAATMDRALRLPGTPALLPYLYGLRLLATGKKEKALQVFKVNQELHPDEKYWTYLGLARAYTALRNKEYAIENWDIALKNAPESEKKSIPEYQKALKELKETR